MPVCEIPVLIQIICVVAVQKLLCHSSGAVFLQTFWTREGLKQTFITLLLIKVYAHNPGGLDLILMPGLGFDQYGKRLGRGKGFYDTYLERCSRHSKGKPYTIALAFKEQLYQEIPVDDKDVLIDEVLYDDEE